MTTGVTGDSISTVNAASHRSMVSYHRQWTGSDGKSEVVSGVRRTKWNNYSTILYSRKRAEDKYVGNRLRWFYAGVDRGWIVTSSPVGYSPAAWSLSNSHDFNNNDQLKLLEKLVEKVKGHDFNLGVNLAQMHQVSGMVDSNLRQITRAILSLKRGNFADAARSLGARPRTTRLRTDDVSGRWLELQYGWLPFISDTFNAAKAFEAISSGPRTNVIRVSHKKKSKYEGSTSPSYHSGTFEKITRRSLIYEMSEELSVERQLGLLDPLSVAWEILPWSFVIDWFIPIGSYFDMLNQVPKLKGRFLQTTVTKSSGVKDLKWVGGSKPSGWIRDDMSVYPDPNEQYRSVRLDRLVLNSPPSVPPPTVSLKGAVHGTRVWNAIALAHQRLGR